MSAGGMLTRRVIIGRRGRGAKEGRRQRSIVSGEGRYGV